MLMLNQEQQIIHLFQQYHRILICLPIKPSTDAIASGLGLYTVLQKLGKTTQVVASKFSLPHTHRFLPNSANIKHELTALRKFVITLDTSKTQVADLHYDMQANQVNIYVSPKNGYFNANNVTTSLSKYDYDLIIVLDSRELDGLGKIFEDNAEFFYNTPIVNIDHHPGNEQFGQVNLVNITATSISEIVFELIQHLDSGHLLDEYIATNLLTGIISKTKSFKTSSVTPRSLAIASHLITSGARRKEIVKNLYQTKSIQTLQLWGKVLSQLQSDPARHLVWSSVHENDFLQTNTTATDLPAVIDELIISTAEAQNIYIVYEHHASNQSLEIRAIVYTHHYMKNLGVPIEWQTRGAEHFVHIIFPGHMTLNMAQTLLHEALEKQLSS